MNKRILFAAMSLVIALAMGILPAGVGHAQSPVCDTGTLPVWQYSNCLTYMGPTGTNTTQFNVSVENRSNWPAPPGASTSISCNVSSQGYVITTIRKSATGTWNLRKGVNISLWNGYTYAVDCTHSWSFGSLFTVTRATHTEISL